MRLSTIGDDDDDAVQHHPHSDHDHEHLERQLGLQEHEAPGDDADHAEHDGQPAIRDRTRGAFHDFEDTPEHPPRTDDQRDDHDGLEGAPQHEERQKYCQGAGYAHEGPCGSPGLDVGERPDDLDDPEAEELDGDQDGQHRERHVRPDEHRDAETQREQTEHHCETGQRAPGGGDGGLRNRGTHVPQCGTTRCAPGVNV